MRKNSWIMKMSLITCFICVVVVGCQKEVVVEEPTSYYFSENLGFQEGDGQIWQEMAQDPVVIKKDDKTITIQNVFWKDGEVIFEANLDNCFHANNDEEQIKIYSENQIQTIQPHSVFTRTFPDSEEIDFMRMNFRYKDSSDKYTFSIFGEDYSVKMQPIKEYASLEDVGYTQTHNGRSIIIKDDGTERKAYTYSNDLWKIVGFDDMEMTWNYYSADEDTRKKLKVPKIQWSSMGSNDGKVYTCTDDNIKKADEFDIPAVALKAECEDVSVTIKLPEEKAQVNIPFSIGQDQYHISEIEVKSGYFDSDKTQECTEVYIRIENVKVEKGTKLYRAEGILGVEEEVLGQSFDSTTGKTETKVYGTRIAQIASSWGNINLFSSNETYNEMEPFICFKIDKHTKLPEEVILKIEEAYKSWNQSFHFEME